MAQSGHHCTDFFLTHFAPQGGRILDENYKPILNGPEGLKTLDYLKIFVETGPTGMTGYSYAEMKNSFVQGDAAFYLDDSKIRKTAEDPKKSRVVGKVGYAMHPKGKVNASGTGGFAMGIPANAKNKEAGFLFIQWFTSKRIDRMLADMGGDPIRVSTMQDPMLQKTNLFEARKDGYYAYRPCQVCDSCLLRAKGFRVAGIEDPLIKHKR